MLGSATLAAASLSLLSCSSSANKGKSTPQSPASQKASFVRTETLQPRSVAQDFDSVGPVARNLWTFNALNTYDAELKTPVFYVTSFVENTGHHGQLIRLDYLHDKAKAWEMPAGIGSWGIIKGQDGNLYMGTYNDGMLLCFNPRASKWIPLPQAPASFRKKEFIITDLVQAPNGDIYYGTYPGAHLVRYDPHAGTVTDLGKAGDEQYLRWLAVTKNGIILCGMGPRHGRVVAYMPKTRTFRTITPARYRTPGVFSKPLATGRYVAEAQHRPGSRVLVYDPTTFKLLHVFTVPAKNNGSGNQSIFTLVDPNHVLYQDDDLKLMKLNLTTGRRTVLFASPGTAANNRWYFDQSGNLLGLLVQSYVYLNVHTGQVTHRPIPLPYPGQDILWLNTTPDGLIYGGPRLGQTFFSYDPKKKLLTSYDQVNDRTGEIYYGIPYEDRIYTISYAEAALSSFDPSKSWNPGESASSNPRTILYMPEDQYRPVGGIHLGPDGKMYIGTQPDYGLTGGALSIFDPKTESLKIHRNIIPNEQVGAVATDDHYVYCETDPRGGGGSKPVASGVHFFVWDPQDQKIVFDHVFSKGDGFRAIAAVNGHAYFVQQDELMDYDSGSKKLKAVHKFARITEVPSESLKATRNGILYGIFGDELGRFDPSTGKYQSFPATVGHATRGLAIGPDGTIYFAAGVDMWSYRPKSPSPPVAFGR
jgi:streptogramin lyase